MLKLRQNLLAFLTTIITTSFGLQSHASTLQVSPILIQFYKASLAQPLWLNNQGDKPLRAQVRVYKWTQDGDGEHLDVTNDVVASPPVMEVGPGQTQLVRLVRKKMIAAKEEESFRVIVDELPTTDLGSESEANALNFLLRYSIPAFISPKSAPSKIFEHKARGEILLSPYRLQIINDGDSRLRLSKLVHEDANGRTTDVIDGLIGYVLAQQQRAWELPPSASTLPPGTFKIKVVNDSGEHIMRLENPR